MNVDEHDHVNNILDLVDLLPLCYSFSLIELSSVIRHAQTSLRGHKMAATHHRTSSERSGSCSRCVLHIFPFCQRAGALHKHQWIFCLTKANESPQFFKGMHKKWWESVKKKRKGKEETKKTKTSPRPSFDQHYNLITCIPKRAFIWDFGLTRLICSVAQPIQREVSKGEKMRKFLLWLPESWNRCKWCKTPSALCSSNRTRSP